MDLLLLEFGDQIEKGHIFVPALIADTFRAMDIVKSIRTKNLECCVAIFRFGFLIISLRADILRERASRRSGPILGGNQRKILKVEKIGHPWRISNPAIFLETQLSPCRQNKASNGPLLPLGFRGVEG